MKSQGYREGLREGVRNPDGWLEVMELRAEAVEQESSTNLVKLEARDKVQQREEQEAHDQLSAVQTEPEDEKESSTIPGWMFLGLSGTLVGASTALVWIALEPFKMGNAAFFICVGTATATAGLVETLLRSFKREQWIPFSLVCVALLGMIGGHFILSQVRAEVMARQAETKQAGTIHVHRGETREAREVKTGNADAVKWMSGKLGKILPAFAVGMEIGAGVLLYMGLAIVLRNDHALRRKLRAIEARRIRAAAEREHWRNWPAAFQKDFEAGARRGSKNRDKIRQQRFAWAILAVATVLIVAALFSTKAGAADSWVVLVDLSGSSGSKDSEGISEHERNIQAGGEILGEIQPGAQVVAVGITDDSFGNPYVLLDATVGEDPGYFNENIDAATEQLLGIWTERTAALRPAFQQTDVLGALDLASQLFSEKPGQERRMILVSDMRESASLDLETPEEIPVPRMLFECRERGLVADLQGVKVHVLGVGTLGKSRQYWSSLRCFWTGYFELAGAELVQFSMLRVLDLTK